MQPAAAGSQRTGARSRSPAGAHGFQAGMRTALLLASLLVGCAAPQPRADSDTVALLKRMFAEDPGSPAVLYTFARAREDVGDYTGTLAWLAQLERSEFDDAIDPEDFRRSMKRPEVKAIADRLAARARVRTPSAVALTLDLPELMPEGHAYDPRRDRFFLSSGRQRKVVGFDRQGRAADLTRSGQDGLLAVLGMKVDVKRDWIWVASTHAPFMADPSPASAGHSTIHAFDLATGETRAAIPYLRTPSLLNDLDLAADGTVYATDSNSGAVIAVRDGELRDVLPPGSFEGPNGLALAPDGKHLYVADFRGLHRVTLATAAVSPLRVPAGARTLGGIDGLYFHDNALIGVQNILGRGRVWRLPVAADGSLAAAEILETGRADYQNPTTGTFADGAFYYLANPRSRQGEPLRLLRLPLAAS